MNGLTYAYGNIAMSAPIRIFKELRYTHRVAYTCKLLCRYDHHINTHICKHSNAYIASQISSTHTHVCTHTGTYTRLLEDITDCTYINCEIAKNAKKQNSAATRFLV